MGSIKQFFDLNQFNLSRKLPAQKRQTDGVEAPRNSIEFTIEKSQGYDVIQEDIPCCNIKQQASEVNIGLHGAPMKKLMGEEMSKRASSRRNTPSVVARLMGMDTLPSEVKPTTPAKEMKDEKPKSRVYIMEDIEMSSSHCAPYHCTSPVEKTCLHDLSYSMKRDSSQSADSLEWTKPQPREHPQEELLQKFKKEFEAWQVSRVSEHSRVLEVDHYFPQDKFNQILAQQNLNKEKMARYWEPKKDSVPKKDTESRGYLSSSNKKLNTDKGVPLSRERYMGKQKQSNVRGDMASNLTQLDVTKFHKKHDRSSSPSRIVILKPCSESSDDAEESWGASPEVLEREGSMQDFLEEVKERLTSEILGKDRRSIASRQIRTESFFSGRSAEMKQSEQHIAKEIKENVNRDLGTALIRSASTRSYRSGFQFSGPDSPELIDREKRKLLSERMKNVIRNETDSEISLIRNGRSRLTKEKMKSRSRNDFSKLGKKENYFEDKKTLAESKAKSHRDQQERYAVFNAEPVSQRNLVRSFSAPVSGTAFARLLLEDQHVLTGAHIHRKHEASELPSPELGRKRKDSFNLRGTVSNLRQNFTLKGKLFGKKTHVIDESAANEFDYRKTILTPPSPVGTLGTVQDNSTEVPPSPASVSSSSVDDFFRPGNPSPVSPLQAPYILDHFAPKESTEISPLLPESRSVSEQVENDGFEEMTNERKSYNNKIFETKDPAEAFIRDVIITAGLDKGESFVEEFSKWDASPKQISKRVFEEVEEAYRRKGKLDDQGSPFWYGDTKISHGMLFDLINEALPSVLKAKPTVSPFKNLISCSNNVPHGRKPFDHLCRQIQVYTSPQVSESDSADSIVNRDVEVTPWFNVSHGDLEVIGREMEWMILRGLIDEFVWEMLPLLGHRMRW